ncbi:MAG: autotransporter outer membrane beta-barrel domain-containing protein, partial [Negativicutes bacterium]
MRSHFNGRHRSRLTLLVLGGLFYSSVASAANLVSTIPSDYGNSEMGTVTGSRVTTQVDADPQVGVLQNLNRDPASFGFHQKGRSMLLLRQYTYSTTELEGTKLIDPNSAGAAASMASGKTTAVPNMHAAAGSDEYIYMTGYDLGQISVVQQSGNRLMENKTAVVNLKNDIKQYCGYNFTETFENLDEDEHGVTGKTYTGDPAKAVVHGEALLVEGRRLYVAASVNPLGGYDPYDDGFLMQYDIQDDGSLKFGSYTRISRNIDQGRLNKFNDHILISCIGGYQHYNGTGNTHYTAISVAKIDESGKLTGTEQRRANLPANVKATGEDMRDIKVLPNGTAYVMTYNLSPAGSQINAHVYQTTVSNLLSEHPENWTEIVSVRNEEGWFGKLNAEYYTKRLWLELGDTLRAYTDGDDTEKYKWQAKDFSENKAFSRFNKITMIEPDWVYGNTASVVMALPPELGGGTTAPTANESAVWKTGAALNDTITTKKSWDADALVNIGTDKLGDKATNVLAAISGTDGRPLNINAKKNLLQLQVENTVGNPTGIYAKGTNVTVSASKGVNIITKGFAGGNSLTNAVQLDAMKNKAARITINGPLNISMQGGFGGNGVAVQKSDRLGEKSYEASVASGIRINGNLKIAGAHTNEWGIPLNRENVFSRFN